MAMQNPVDVVVVGFGWVGQANAVALTLMGYKVGYVDPATPAAHYGPYAEAYKQIRRLENILEADSPKTVYIVSVGDKVSEEGEQDISAIEAALRSVEGVAGTVVLRSTVLPDALQNLSFDYYMPEFLHEKRAVEECLSPHFFVLGRKEGSAKPEPRFFAQWRRHTPKHFEGTPREAAFVKYLSNIWNATRIAFVNEFGDAIAEPSSAAAVDSISRVINFVLEGEGYTRYGRAFGGHCLPKDTRAFAKFHAEQDRHVDLIRGVYSSNEKHRVIEGRYQALPEWFSNWETPHLSGFVAWRELRHSIIKNISDPREFMLRYWKSLGIVAAIILLTNIALVVIK